MLLSRLVLTVHLPPRCLPREPERGARKVWG